MDKVFIPVGRFTIGAALLALNLLLRGYVIAWFWAWFVAPVWNFAYLSVYQAIGISFFVSLFTLRTDRRKPKPEEEYSHPFMAFMSLVLHLMILGCGWILFRFFGG
jgi:membrane-associated protease RseP (regulator of RpoE activity)